MPLSDSSLHDDLQTAALALLRRIDFLHARPEGLFGPDPGIRFHLRVGRFVHSAVPRLARRRRYYYLQAQAYWIWSLLALDSLGLTTDGVERARAVAREIVRRQHEDGSWDYPNPEWRGRLAALEGSMAGRAVLAVHARSPDPTLLQTARRWARCLEERVGYQEIDGEKIFRYFGNVKKAVVPNSALACVAFLGALHRATGDPELLAPVESHLRFVRRIQTERGEIPYALDHPDGKGRPHYLCFQYNAYQLLDLADYRRATGDDRVDPITEGLARFVCSGLTRDGWLRRDCLRARPDHPYHTAAAAAALAAAHRLGLEGYLDASRRAYRCLLDRQRPDGGWDWSRGDYRGLLRDRTSYPRYDAMILAHLLDGIEQERRLGLAAPAGSTGS